MKIFIWEGKGISAGYHDDGTLVILAETPEQARELARASIPVKDDSYYRDGGMCRTDIWLDGDHNYWGGLEPNQAIDRDPDRVVEIDAPGVVVFNGGGYD
jgi:hypothetical protein